MPLGLSGDGEITGFDPTASGFGKVLQVVSATYSTQVQNNTSTYADTGLTATITPSSASNKILVLINQNGCYKVGSNNTSAVQVQLLRGSTQIFYGMGGYTGTTNENSVGTIGGVIFDSPATTSAVTYKSQFKNQANATGVLVQHDSSVSTLTLIEVAA